MLLYGKSIVKHSRWWYGDTDLEPLKRKKPDQPSREPPLKRAFRLQVCGDTVTLSTYNLENVYQVFKTIGTRKESAQMRPARQESKAEWGFWKLASALMGRTVRTLDT